MPPQNENRAGQQVRVPVLPVLIGAIAVLAIVAIAAVALTGNDKKTSTVVNGVPQTRPVTVTGSALASFRSTANDPAVGRTAPTLTGQNFAGTPVSIGNDGHAKAVVFVAHWCPHCQREVPRLADYLHATGLPAGVELFFVPTNTNPNYPNYPPSAWLQRDGVSNVPTLVDSKNDDAYAAFGGTSFPYFVLLDKTNHVVARLVGEQQDGVYPGLFEALAKGEKIAGG